MIYSMTGYGKSVAIYQDRKICVEIRSLNGKSMDLSARVAPQFKSHEMEIRTLITNRLERGKVDFSLYVQTFSFSFPQQGKISCNKPDRPPW